MIRSVYETPRNCVRCNTEYTPKRPSADRRGTFSEFCSHECQRKAVANASAEGQAARRAESRSSFNRDIPRPSKPKAIRAPRAPRVPYLRIGRTMASGDLSPFAQHLASLRRGRLWRRADLAARVGVAENTVMNWELDRTEIAAKWVEKLADIFNMRMDDLWRGKTS